MAFHDERMFPGGLYFEGRENDNRTDVSVVGVGQSTETNPFSVVTGNVDVAIIGIPIEGLRELAQWLLRQADDLEQESRAIS